MAKYREKSVIIEAVQLRWDTWDEICAFAGVGKLEDGKPEGNQDEDKIGLDIPTRDGLEHAFENDWIVKSVHGEFYPVNNSIFKITYELVEE